MAAKNNSPLTAKLRSAMTAIDAIAAMADVPVQERQEALNRICIFLQRREEMMPPPEERQVQG